MSPEASQDATPREIHPFDEENEYGDAEKNFQLKSPKFWLIVIGMYLAIFLVALDRLIIATAIPSITDEFHSIEDIGWYGSAYMLTAAIFNPLFGRIYQLYSTKWSYLISILIFEVGSALCGAAPSSTAFIVGRAIAGIGSAGIFCGGVMIIVPLVPLRKRPIFMSFFGLAFGVSSVLGPLVGGLFTDNSKLTWRWCFYINLPIGGFTLAATLLCLNIESPPRKKLTILGQFKQLDPLGLLFFVPSMVCLILALQWGGTTYSWSAPRIVGLLVAFCVLFIAFIAVEALMPETAMAPARVILNRTVAGTMLFMFLLSGGMMSVIYYLTIWFQAAQGQSAIQSGIHTIPLILGMIIIGILAAVFVQKVGYYAPPMLLSPVLCAVGSGMLSTLKQNAGRNQWLGYQILYGIGIGCGFQTSHIAPQTVLPRADVPLGVALLFFMQQFGGAIFVAAAQNVFSSQLVDGISGVVDVDAQTIINTGATALRSVVPARELQAVIVAYSYALTRVFVLAAGLSACMIIGAAAVEWKSVKGKKGKENKDAGTKAEEIKNEGKVKEVDVEPKV